MEKARTIPIAPNPAIYLILLAVASAAAFLIALFPDARRCRLCRRTPEATAFPSARHLPPGFPDDLCWQCMESTLRTALPPKNSPQ